MALNSWNGIHAGTFCCLTVSTSVALRGATIERRSNTPVILDVFELPHRFEPTLDCSEAVTFVERTRAKIAGKRIEPQAAAGVFLGPCKQLRANAERLNEMDLAALCTEVLKTVRRQQRAQ